MVLEEAKIFNKPIILTNTAAKECAKGYDKALVLDNNFKGIVNGLEKELKSDNVKYLESNFNKNNAQNGKTNENFITNAKDGKVNENSITNSKENLTQNTNEEVQEQIIRKIKNIL